MTSSEEGRPLLRPSYESPASRAEEKTAQVGKIAWENISVSYVLIFILSVATSMYGLCLQQYVYNRMKAELIGDHDNRSQQHTCYQNKSSPEYHLLQKVQGQASQKLMQFDLASLFPALISTIFLGSYSDYLGRRMMFSVGLSGLLCLGAVFTLVVGFSLSLDWMFVGYVLYGCCGSYFSLLLVFNAYNADNTPPTSHRTLTNVLFSMASSLGILIGEMGSGYFIKSSGFFHPFLTATLIVLAAFAFMVLVLKETCPKAHAGFRDLPGLKDGVKRVFSFYFLRSWSAKPASPSGDLGSLRVTDQDRRLEYWLGISTLFLSLAPYESVSTIITLFVMNTPFCWDSTKIGNYDAAKDVISKLICSLIFASLMQVVREEAIGLLGLLSMIGGFLVMAFAVKDWMLYFAPAVAVFSSLGITVMKSMMSQRTPPGRQGALFASQAITEPVGVAAGKALFNSVYSATVVGHYKGVAFLAMAGMAGLALVCMGAYFLVIVRNKRLLTNMQHASASVNTDS